VPIAAISSASGQEYVWTVENGKLLRRTVTTGRRDPVRDRAEVLEGLSADVPVLGARFDNLREGAKARIVTVATAATPKPLAPVVLSTPVTR
jgi:membrane fusion protein, multidrug efflux system